jgi:hypothetical protein
MGREGSIPSGGAQNRMNFGNESVERRHHDGVSGGLLLQFCAREKGGLGQGQWGGSAEATSALFYLKSEEQGAPMSQS